MMPVRRIRSPPMFSVIDVIGATVVTTLIFFACGAGGADPGSSFLPHPVATRSKSKIGTTPLLIIRFMAISPRSCLYPMKIIFVRCRVEV
jgi:hypothetical protein